jgi:RNA polymerase sigma-70 factor, ECF subfamily
VAHGYAHGPAAGLALLARARAGGALDGYPLAVAAEADLTARSGQPDRAAALFREAAAQARGESERQALLTRATEIQTTRPAGQDRGRRADRNPARQPDMRSPDGSA